MFSLRIILLLTVVTALPLLSSLQEDRTTFHVSEMPGYSGPEQALRELTNQRGRTGKNTFCIVGYQYPDRSTQAWVYWIEGKAIILWEPVRSGPVKLAGSSRYLRIPRDVVPNEDALQGSTYRVTRKWVDDLIQECRLKGEAFTIRKH